MALTSSKLTTDELTGRILEMAQTGVYRESIFEAFQPVATKRQIRSAIAQAKQFGLRSVATLRDADLGTYYQADSAHYERFQTVLKSSNLASALANGEDLTQRLVGSSKAMKTMLVVAGGSALGLFGVGSLYLLNGQAQMGGTLWLGAVLTGAIWLVQRTIAKQFF
ncbi:MAG TPA: hypothetical protein V6D06_00625 [Trichocoleus sp.]